MSQEKKVELATAEVAKIRKAKGFVNVKYLKDLGNIEKDHKCEMHRSTAMALEVSGIVKIESDVKVYKPKKIKE